MRGRRVKLLKQLPATSNRLIGAHRDIDWWLGVQPISQVSIRRRERIVRMRVLGSGFIQPRLNTPRMHNRALQLIRRDVCVSGVRRVNKLYVGDVIVSRFCVALTITRDDDGAKVRKRDDC